MEQELDRRLDSSALGTVATLDDGIQEKGASEQKRLGCGMYFIFVLLGTAILMPFNCFITPGDYIITFYPGDLYFSLCSSLNNVGNWSMMWVMLKFGHKLNANVMVQVSLVVWLVALVLTPLVAIVIKDGDNEDKAKSIRMGLTGCLILICGAFNGVAFPMTFSVASRLSWDMCQAIMNGNGVAGIVAVLINIIVTGVGLAIDKGSSEEDRKNFLRYATLAYFVISGIIVGSCIIAWNIVMKRFPELKHDIHDDAPSGQGAVEPGEINPKTGRRYTTVEISRHLIIPGMAVFLVFFITLSLFPQITNMAGVFFYYKSWLDSDGKPKTGTSLTANSFTWWNLGYTANFMVGDWIGRAIPKIEVLSRIKVVPILIFSCCRFIFLPLFLLFAVPRSTDGLEAAPALVKPFCGGDCANSKGVIGADVIVQIIMLIFAITNGYVGSVAMVRFVDCLPHMSYAGDGGRVMSLFLNTGLFFGSFTSLAISLILSG